MPIRMTGLVSGLDTESIIQALVSSYNHKTGKYKKAQTKLGWKQEAWKTLNSKIYSLYKSLDGLRFSQHYNLKSTTCSDTTKAKVSAGSNAVNGTQQLNVLQVAQAGYLTGGKLADGVKGSTTLAELGYTGGDAQIDVTMGDGTKKSITVTQGTTVNEFVNSLKEAGVSASYDEANKRIYVSSKDTGVANDFTLTGSNLAGSDALSKLGLCVSSDATQATYESYTKYYDADGNTILSTVKSGVEAYKEAFERYQQASAQNGNLTAAYGYASAYSAMQDALKGSNLSEEEQEKLKSLLAMTAKERTDSLMDASGNIYKQEKVEEDGSVIYSDGDQYIKAVTTYTGSDDKTYTKNADGTYQDEAGTVYKATGKKDADGNALYADEAGNEITISSKVEYYNAEKKETPTGRYQYTDADGITYSEDALGNFRGSDGKLYQLADDGMTMQEYDQESGAVLESGRKGTVTPELKTEIMDVEYIQGTAASDIQTSSDALTSLKEKSGLTEEQITALASNISKVNSFEAVSDSVLEEGDPYSRESIVKSIHEAYESGGASGVADLVNSYGEAIAQNNEAMKESQATMEEHKALADLAKLDSASPEYEEALQAFKEKVEAAKANLDYLRANGSEGAKKIDGQDAIITLNGIEYTGSSNAFSINGLTITAQAVTGPGEENAVTITTQTDVQGMYDKIKDFLTQYNSLINEMTSLYNADTAKGYEPLTDEERDALSETEVEKWESKIKSSLLRRDDSLESIMNIMTSSMNKGVEVNGETYYLSSFGIKTLGYLNAAENEQNAFHIDGDADDASVSGNADKLMAALTEDPDTVVEFMQGLVNNLYTGISKKMESSSLSSVWKVYNDKEMASEYDEYTALIQKWEKKLADQEEYYYRKFAAMESALSKLQSQTSSMSNLFGSL